MGINGLSSFINERCPNALGVVPLKLLSGRWVGVDAHNLMYCRMAIARKNVISKTDILMDKLDEGDILREWLSEMLYFIIDLMGYNIKPLIIFDGTAHPEKDKTREKRKDSREKARIKLEEAWSKLQNIPVLERRGMESEMRKLLSNYVIVSSSAMELFKDLLDNIGIPTMRAKHDGEQLGALLCREGKIVGLFSTDSDCIVYGCPLVFTGFDASAIDRETGDTIKQFKALSLESVLQGLSLDHQRLVEFSIMCGCDFNTNIRMVGPVKSYKYISELGSIDKLPSHLDKSCLDHIRCREIFQIRPSSELIQDGEQRIINPYSTMDGVDRIIAILDNYRLGRFSNMLYKAFSGLTIQPTKSRIRVV